MFLIIIHELGHFLVAKLLKVEVNKIILYPLGGISKFFLPLNASFQKELLILLAGPLFQILAKSILIIILPRYAEIIRIYHTGILFFNLLPVYPLDGGKLLHLFFSMFLPYKKSLNIAISLSYITIIFILFINANNLKINTITMLIFLLIKVYSEQNKVNYIYEKFILERYLTDYKFKKSKLITTDKDFYKNNRHIIKENNNYLLEKDYLIKKYQKN